MRMTGLKKRRMRWIAQDNYETNVKMVFLALVMHLRVLGRSLCIGLIRIVVDLIKRLQTLRISSVAKMICRS